MTPRTTSRDIVGGLEIIGPSRHWRVYLAEPVGGRGWEPLRVVFHRRRDAVAARAMVLKVLPGHDAARLFGRDGVPVLDEATGQRVDRRISEIRGLVAVVVARHRERRCLECGSFGSDGVCGYGRSRHAPRREISPGLRAYFGGRPLSDESGPLLTPKQVAWAR